jgi:hypothetical protein
VWSKYRTAGTAGPFYLGVFYVPNEVGCKKKKKKKRSKQKGTMKKIHMKIRCFELTLAMRTMVKTFIIAKTNLIQNNYT